jgi:hypothetical protein
VGRYRRSAGDPSQLTRRRQIVSTPACRRTARSNATSSSRGRIARTRGIEAASRPTATHRRLGRLFHRLPETGLTGVSTCPLRDTRDLGRRRLRVQPSRTNYLSGKGEGMSAEEQTRAVAWPQGHRTAVRYRWLRVPATRSIKHISALQKASEPALRPFPFVSELCPKNAGR